MSGTVELHGIELLTRDVERLVGFYQKVLHAGREDSHGGPDRVELLLPNGGKGANLTITRNPQAPDDGQRAICMEIWVDDVDREYEWLLENQITVSRPARPLCPGAFGIWGCTIRMAIISAWSANWGKNSRQIPSSDMLPIE